jgi:hypothetical protein
MINLLAGTWCAACAVFCFTHDNVMGGVICSSLAVLNFTLAVMTGVTK